MTTCTSSSARSVARAGALLLCTLAVACGGSDVASAERAPDPARTESAPAPAAATATSAVDDLRAAYTRDLTEAVAGRRGGAAPPAGGFGMSCSPPAIRTSAPDLVLELPAAPDQRRHVLAVVTPTRGLLEVYSPYDDETEAGDLLLPSDVITWGKARTQARFAVRASSLDGLRRGGDTPEALFIEEGRYRFALVNSIDVGLLKSNREAVKVFAACSFDWTPEVTKVN
jgi:hypothetical protein